MENEQLYKQAIETWGQDSQLILVVEELAELQKELIKQIRGKGDRQHIAEEIADVEIMLGQVEIMFNNRKAVDQFKKSKMKRLVKLLEDAKKT